MHSPWVDDLRPRPASAGLRLREVGGPWLWLGPRPRPDSAGSRPRGAADDGYSRLGDRSGRVSERLPCCP